MCSILSTLLDRPCWYHGTSTKFSSWQIPPPKKDPLSVPHSSLFFTTNRDFAQAAGPNLATARLSSDAYILDCTVKSDKLEELRELILRHPHSAMFENFTRAYWHEGWKTGDVLRPAANKQGVDYLKSLVPEQAKKMGLSSEQAWIAVQHNATRGLIELICIAGCKLGFDALYGNEVYRHTNVGKKLSQPWLAVMKKTAISTPVWNVA